MTEMNKDIAMRLDDVSIRFRLRNGKDFFAVKNLSMTLKKGDILGILGRNGSGKSTLLKAIAGILSPDSGSVYVDGVIAPLIELGASFLPDLTGKENIFLAGSYFGYPKKTIEENVNRIIEFSGVREFIDQPVKTYSTGMFVRLSFATMLFFKPDVVLLDEIFAVGDDVFQKRSMNKILEFKEQGKTILIASHDVGLIERFSNKVIIMEKGRKIFEGDPEEATSLYLYGKSKNESENNKTLAVQSQRWGNKHIELRDIKVLNNNGETRKIFDKNDYFEINIGYKIYTKKNFTAGIAIRSRGGTLITGPNIVIDADRVENEGTIRYIIDKLPINEGEYLIDVAFYDTELLEAYDHINNAKSFTVRKSTIRDLGLIDLKAQWRIGEHEID